MRRVVFTSKRGTLPTAAVAAAAARRSLFTNGANDNLTRKLPHTTSMRTRLHTVLTNSTVTRIQRASFCTPTAAVLSRSGVEPSFSEVSGIPAIPAAVRVQTAAERLTTLLTSASVCADRSDGVACTEASTNNGRSEEISEVWTELGNAMRDAAYSFSPATTGPSLTTTTERVSLDASNQLYTALSSADPRVSVCGRSVSCLECYKEAIGRAAGGAIGGHVGADSGSAVVHKAWEGLGVLLTKADVGRVASGAMPLFVNVGGKNLTAVDCLAKSIETYTCIGSQKKGSDENINDGPLDSCDLLYFGAPLSLWQKLAWGLRSRQTEIDTVAGGAAEGYDVKKRAATVTIRGEVFDAEAALVVVAILSQPSSSRLYATTWTQLATFVTERGKAAVRDFARRRRGYEEAMMAQREGEIPSSVSSSSKLTPPQLPEPPSVRVPVDSALPLSAYAFLTSSSFSRPLAAQCAAESTSPLNSITLSVTDVLAKLIEALLLLLEVEVPRVHVGGDEEAVTNVRGSSIDSLLLLSSAWLQLGDALASKQKRSGAATENQKEKTAFVGNRSYTPFECYVKAAEAADAVVCAASSTATSLNRQTLDSLSYVWHALGSHIRARSSLALRGAKKGEEEKEVTLTVAVVSGDLEEGKISEAQSTGARTLRRSAVAFTARKAFAKAVEIAPHCPSHWLNLALALPDPSPDAFTYADVPDVQVGDKPYVLSDKQPVNTQTAVRGVELTTVAGVVGYTKAQLLTKVIELEFESCPAQQRLPTSEEASRAFGLLGACLLAEDAAKASKLNEKVHKVVQDIVSKAGKTLTRDMLPTAMPAIVPSVATVAVPSDHMSIDASLTSSREVSTCTCTRVFTARECLLTSIESFMLSGEGLPFTGETGQTWLLLGELLMAESQTQRSAEGGLGRSAPCLLFVQGISESEGSLCASQCFANAVSCLPNSPEAWLRCGSSLFEEANFECDACTSDMKDQTQQTIYARRAVEVDGRQYTIVDCLSKALELTVERSAVATGAEPLPASDSVYYQMLGTAMERVGVKSVELRLGRKAPSSFSSEELLLRATGRPKDN